MTKRNYECHLSICKHVNSKRTIDQNSALHLYFSHIAQELNNAGFPIKKTLEHYRIDLDWDTQSVKDLIWKPIQSHFYGTASTTELKKTQQIENVYEHINRFLSNEPFNIHIPFPHDPEKYKQQQYVGEQSDYYPTEDVKPLF